MIVKKTNIINTYFSKLIKRKPKIAILGLNPHNSEFSNKSEEKKIIIPAQVEVKETETIPSEQQLQLLTDFVAFLEK